MRGLCLILWFLFYSILIIKYTLKKLKTHRNQWDKYHTLQVPSLFRWYFSSHFMSLCVSIPLPKFADFHMHVDDRSDTMPSWFLKLSPSTDVFCNQHKSRVTLLTLLSQMFLIPLNVDVKHPSLLPHLIIQTHIFYYPYHSTSSTSSKFQIH